MQDRNILNNRVTRQPALHEYSSLAMKLRINDDDDKYCIEYPILACDPLNADFDGDTVSCQLVPEEAAEEVYDRMSPRYITTYKKNNEPIYTFSHEMLNGAAIASEYVFDDISELKEPREYYTDYTQLLKDVEVEKKLNLGKPITFTGKVGELEFKNKVTTYGRLRISKIIGADIDKIGIFKGEYDRIDANSAAKLTAYLNSRPNNVEKIQELQKFFLRVVTKAGVVTFDYKTLYVNTNTETYKKICNIADSTTLTDKQKLLLMTEEFHKYEKEVEEEFSKDIVDEVKRSGRVKLSSIVAMTMPQFITSGVEERPQITRGTLLNGYTEEDFIIHSVENRSLQGIKQSGVGD